MVWKIDVARWWKHLVKWGVKGKPDEENREELRMES